MTDENGWASIYYEKIGVNIFGSEAEYKSLGKWRPISLKGIENNNNWIRIESEDDLPKIPSFYWCSDKDNALMQVHYEDISVGYHTHYQPIIKPQPPIY